MANWGNIGSRGTVSDRRGLGPVAFGSLSLTGLALMLLFNYLSGGNPVDVLNDLQGSILSQEQVVNQDEFAGEDTYEVFASTVLGSNNDLWTAKFREVGRTYREPTLVLFRTATQSSCGVASSEVGPHYCPLDETIYLDETFFDVLTQRFGARLGDVSHAYVISHEVAHHVQNQLGLLNRNNPPGDTALDQNQLSVLTELQADCFAGMWVNSIQNQDVLEPGEVHEAMDAAAAVGDDRIQQSTTGRINPENWTHGSSEQRVDWFNRGYNTGSLEACNTFIRN